ncbi:hypothetical protein QJQ45_000208 [Haematococcus lacustris]|nr:hypothetical protein QJQ45_000208 [Haematococcus lacustris]
MGSRYGTAHNTVFVMRCLGLALVAAQSQAQDLQGVDKGWVEVKAWSLYSHVLSPMLSTLLRVLRSFTNLQASMAAAAAVAAGMLAALGLTSLLLLSLARRYTEVQSSIERPLHFDYSGPVASAWTSLQAEAATGMTLLGLLNPLAWLSLVSRSQPSTPPSLPDQASSWDVGGYQAAALARHQQHQQQYGQQQYQQQQYRQQQQYGQQWEQQHPYPASGPHDYHTPASSGPGRHHMGAPPGQTQATPGHPASALGYHPQHGPGAPTPYHPGPPSTVRGVAGEQQPGSAWVGGAAGPGPAQRQQGGRTMAPPTDTAVEVQGGRAVPSGQQVSVWVTLQLPPAHADLLQLAGELWGPGPRLLASASKTYMAQPQPLLLRLSRYQDLSAAPVVSFRALLASRNSSVGSLPPPPVYGASLSVKLHLGLGRTLLHWLQPSWPVVLTLGTGAALLTLTSGACCLALLLLALLLHRLGQPAVDHSAGAKAVQAANAAAAMAQAAAMAATEAARQSLGAGGGPGGGRGWREGGRRGQAALGAAAPAPRLGYTRHWKVEEVSEHGSESGDGDYTGRFEGDSSSSSGSLGEGSGAEDGAAAGQQQLDDSDASSGVGPEREDAEAASDWEPPRAAVRSVQSVGSRQGKHGHGQHSRSSSGIGRRQSSQSNGEVGSRQQSVGSRGSRRDKHAAAAPSMVGVEQEDRGAEVSGGQGAEGPACIGTGLDGGTGAAANEDDPPVRLSSAPSSGPSAPQRPAAAEEPATTSLFGALQKAVAAEPADPSPLGSDWVEGDNAGNPPRKSLRQRRVAA